jgi:NAD(P)-dependent dehydrogenase (short-subunit alcohol dehydrogenase family)
MDFAGQLAVVTGATEGIGRAIAFALGRAGAAVGICARTEARVRSTVEALRQEGVDAIGAACDVGDADAVAAFAAQVGRERGEPRVLVNNAGIARLAPLERLSLADWDAVMATNVRSLFLVTRAFLPALKRTAAAGGATIVNIASLAGRNGLEDGTAYCASKHAVLGFSKALMLEVRRHGVRVVAICPGTVATALLSARPRAAAERVLAPEDVAGAVLGALALPGRAMVSELDLRPTNP